MLAALEATIQRVWHDLDGTAKAELEKALEAARERQAQLLPMIKTAEADLKAAVAAAEPGVKSVVESRAGKLVTEVAALLGVAA